ncbi:MAG: 4Fe-4S dicluster domain-containing protein, partial [Patescibacteria group bacterium]|nr:4Fe-4S dicluster domain-containing protein [Patescibacteria group bacterium]
MAKIIYDTQIGDFLDHLAEEYAVFLPTENNPRSFSAQFKFGRYQKGTKPILNYPLTVLPPKEFIFPAEDVLFKYQKEQIIEAKPQKQIIFGLSYDDLEGIEKLRKVFEVPVRDKPIVDKLENTILIAIDRYSPPGSISFDLYLQEIEKGVFVAFVGSKKGKTLLGKGKFKDHKIQVPTIIFKKDPLLSDPNLSMALKKSKDHPIWSELSKKCFGCGICSYVCPLCYCYDVKDKPEFGAESCGVRCRTWDSCLLKNFAETSNHNFRTELK